MTYRPDNTVAVSIEQLAQLGFEPLSTAGTAPLSDSAWLGHFRSRQRGQGHDMDDLRPYSAGDDTRHIHWRASAKGDQLYTRVYREDKDLRIRVLCDLRPCMFTGSAELRATQAVYLTARIIWRACRQACNIQLVVFTDQTVYCTQPGTGHRTAINACGLLAERHAHAALDTAASTHTHYRAFTEALDPDPATLSTVLSWSMQSARQYQSVLWVSGLDHPGHDFDALAKPLNQYNRCAFIYTDDRLCRQALPNGFYAYRDASGSTTWQRRITANDSRDLQQRLDDAQQQIRQRFDTLGIALLSTVNGQSAVLQALQQQACLP